MPDQGFTSFLNCVEENNDQPAKNRQGLLFRIFFSKSLSLVFWQGLKGNGEGKLGSGKKERLQVCPGGRCLGEAVGGQASSRAFCVIGSEGTLPFSGWA